MNNTTRAALAAAFAMMVCAGPGTAFAQGVAPAPVAPPAPTVVGHPTTYAPAVYPEGLPLVYAPGPGYGSFSKAPTEMICSPPAAPARFSGRRYLPAPVGGAVVGVLTAAAVCSIFL